MPPDPRAHEEGTEVQREEQLLGSDAEGGSPLQSRMQAPMSVATTALLLLLSVVASAPIWPKTDTQEPTSEGKPASFWIAELGRGDMDGRLHATTALTSMGQAAVPYLLRALEGDQSDVRLRILTTLGMLGSDAEAALPAISALLHDSSASVRITAAATMVAIDCRRGEEVWPVLIAALDGDSFAASLAAGTIGRLGADGAEAVPNLIRLIGATDPEVQLAALGALWKMGVAAQAAIPSLKEAAKSDGAVGVAARAALETATGQAPTPIPSCRSGRTEPKR